MTPKEQRALMIAATTKVVQQDGSWQVPAQRAPSKFYTVDLIAGTCDCDLKADWADPCEHMLAAEIVAQREGLPSHLLDCLKRSVDLARARLSEAKSNDQEELTIQHLS